MIRRTMVSPVFQKRTKSNITFDRIVDEFLSMQRGKGNAEQTIKHYDRSAKKIKRFLCWYTDEKMEFDELTAEEIVERGGKTSVSKFEQRTFEEQFREFLVDVEGVNEVTVNCYLRDYRVYAYWMMDQGYIAPRKIIIAEVETDIKEVYTEAEVAKLIKKPKNGCSFAEYRTWVVIHHLLATGNRLSTICNIRIQDVDWDEGMLSIQKQKNKKKTRIPLEETYLNVLKTYVNTWLRDEDGEYVCTYLFPSAYVNSVDKPLNRVTMGHAIAEYNLARGVKKTSSHLFRHTFAKHWIVAGKDLHSLQKMLGHSTLEMVTKYANLYDVDLKPKVEEKSILKDQMAYVRNHGKTITRKRMR